MDAGDENLPNFASENENSSPASPFNSSVSENHDQVKQRISSVQKAPKLKKRKLTSVSLALTTEIEIQCKPEMVDEACQTDGIVVTSPQKLISISHNDVCHAIQHDHPYTSTVDEGKRVNKNASLHHNPNVANARQSLDLPLSPPKKVEDYPENCYIKDETSSEPIYMSDTEESETSDSESDFEFDESDFISDGSDCEEEMILETEHYEDEGKENRNWLNEDCGNIQEERKFIVFESKLKEIFTRFVRCPNCWKNVQAAKLTTKGCVAIIDSLHCCKQPVHWQSQPFVRSMAAGNLLLSASILFTGNDYSNFSNIAKATNLQIFSQRNFLATQKKWLFPILNKKFNEHQQDVLNEVRNTEVTAGGDGRCDSPGHSAKYGTYSIVDTNTSKVIDFSLVQVTEVKNSNAMELEGLKRCLDHLQQERVVISKLATDRHVQVRAHMKKERPQIKHNFDVWHMAKSVQKKLTKKAQIKQCSELKQWIQAIITHLWWCAKTSQGNGNQCAEKWKSIVYHTANIHHWDGCQDFHECAHPPIPQEIARRKKWLRVGAPAHDALKEVVWNKSLLKDVAMLAEFIHTGVLEMYHGLMAKKYCPKLQHYSYDGMRARTQLAILDHNHNVGRTQAQTKEGVAKNKFVFPRGSGHWVVKPQYEMKSYQFLSDLMDDLVACKRDDTNVPPLPPKPAARNIATTERPPKEDLLDKHRSRFNRSS